MTQAPKDKFYLDTQYEKLYDPAYFDTWAWASQCPSKTDPDAYNSYVQLSHGVRLQNMVRNRKAELMEVLFPLRTSTTLQCMSFPELEYSYGLHLNTIINRLGFNTCDNITGFVDSDVTAMIIEVGRFFAELESSNLSFSNVSDAVGSFACGPWSDEARRIFSLNELYRRCREKGLMKDWEGYDVVRIDFNRSSGTISIERHAGFLYILETIFAIGKSNRQSRSLQKSISSAESQMFILDFLDLFSDNEAEVLEQANDNQFAAHDLNLQVMQNLGGLRVVWTDNIDDHLRLSTVSRTITLFWDISLLNQSLLFWYHARSLRNFGFDKDPKAPRELKYNLMHELKSTYRLLFYNNNAKQYTTTETCAIKSANRNPGIMIHDLRVDVNWSRARKILRQFLDTPLPPTFPQSKPDITKGRRYRHLWWPIARILERPSYLFRRNLENTISTHFDSGLPYSLDLCWHLENILNPYPALAGESDPMRSFANFPRFGSRLREIKFYMDNQRPSRWYQMWKDKRDRVQYVTFWAVLVFGTISILLALVSIAISTAQTVAAFRSVNGAR